MTAQYSANGLLKDITAVGANAVHSFNNYLFNRFGLTHGGANLQGFKNHKDGTGYVYGSVSSSATTGRTAHAGSATTQKRRRTKNEKQTNKVAIKPILGRINALRLPNGRYQMLQPPASPERQQSSSPSPTTSSTAVTATWTSAFDATSTSPTISCNSSTPFSSDLASLIGSSFILDY